MVTSEDAGDNDIVGVCVCSVAAKEDTNIFQQDRTDKNVNSTIF